MSDFNNPEGLKKLRLKLSISRMLSNRRIVYTQSIKLQTRTEDDTLFKQAVDELVKEGCATRIKGRMGARCSNTSRLRRATPRAGRPSSLRANLRYRPMSEILTIDELAQFLEELSRSAIYSMTRRRARVRMDNPLPALRINGNIRFRKSDVEKWLDEIAREEAA